MGIITANNHGFNINDAVVFQTTGQLPNGLNANAVYYVLPTSFTANQFTVSSVPGGNQLYFYGNQSGVQTVSRAMSPPARLAWSNDGGHTWSNEYQGSLGALGLYKTRMIWRRLGYARDRVFRLRIDAPVKRNLVDGYIEVSK